MSKHRRNSSMNSGIKNRIENIKDWVSSHVKIVMPVVLIVCVGITVAIAINANKSEAEQETIAASEIEEAAPAAAEEPVEEPAELELNAYPAVNQLVADYHSAIASKDMDKVAAINPYLDNMEKMYISQLSNFVEAHTQLDVYTKPGPVENSYIAYVYSKVKFTDFEKPVPGMQAFYICTDENGNCYINDGEENTVVTNYLKEVSLQSDVVELNNRVTVEYNELVESDEELKAFLDDLNTRISVSVGEVLAQEMNGENGVETADAAQTDAAGEAADTETTAEGQETAAAATPENTVKTVKAKEVVNIRSSDSETADKLGKAQVGDEFTLLEEKGNGWSKISFDGKDAFIKTEFLEVVKEETAPVEDTQQAEADEAETTDTEEDTQTAQTEPEEETTQDAASTGTQTTVRVLESVNVRKSANEKGEKLGLVYAGEKLELVMKQADGWTKVKYKGQTGFVKSEYVE